MKKCRRVAKGKEEEEEDEDLEEDKTGSERG